MHTWHDEEFEFLWQTLERDERSLAALNAATQRLSAKAAAGSGPANSLTWVSPSA
jgi:hypothetical protein